MALDARFLSRHYEFPSLGGSGQTLAIVEVGDSVVLDSVQTYCSALARPTPKVIVAPATAVSDGARWTDGAIGPTAAAQLAAALLPAGEISLHVIDGTEQGILNGVAEAIHSGAAVVCVNVCEPETAFSVQLQQALQRLWLAAALTGVTVCCPAALASGRTTEGAPYPACSDHVLAVGCAGLLLRLDGTTAGEYAMTDYMPFSQSVAAPPWQAAATCAHRRGDPGNAGRALPDVVACDGCDLLIDGRMRRIQSPGLACIVWGALLTLACERLGHPLGFVTDAIWSSAGLGGTLRQVAVSYDPTKQKLEYMDPWYPWTGWGSPDGTRVVAALAGALAARQGMTAEQCTARGLELLSAWLVGHSRTDLDGAIDVLRNARLLRPANPDELEDALTGELQALKERLSLSPRPADLDEIIEVVEAAIALSDAPDRRADLGYHRMLRYLQRGSIDDLNAAVVEFKMAFTQTRLDDVARYTHLLNVAWASEARYDRKRARGEQYIQFVVGDSKTAMGPRDLVLPIDWLQTALSLQPGAAPPPAEIVPRLKRNLANLLLRFASHVRHRPTAERAAEVERGVRLLEEALSATAPDSEDRVTCANSLWAALVGAEALGFVDPALYDDPARKAKLIETLTSTADVPVNPVIRAQADSNLAALLVARSQPGDEDQARAISIYRALVTTTTPGTPAASLEAALTWSQWALARGAWEEAAEAHRGAQFHIQSLIAEQQDWNDRYLWTQRAGAVAAAGAYALAQLGQPGEAADALDRGRAIMLSSRLELVGVHSGSTPPECCLIYVLATIAGGLALVSDHGSSWTARWLPAFDADAVGTRAGAYGAAYNAFSREEGAAAGLVWLQEVDRTLRFVSEALAEVFRDLPRDRPTAVVAVGALGLLPIFAAAAEAAPDGARISVLPSVRLFQNSPRVVQPQRALVVRDETLANSEWETKAALASFSSRGALLPQAANVEALLRSWPEGGLVHVAAHASVDFGTPLQSGVRLPGGERLTVERIVLSAVAPAALAVLSACETGVPDPSVSDEGVGIAAVLLTGAAEGAIATLWPVDDLGSSLLMLRFYWYWRCRDAHPSLALSRAQLWLRDASQSEKLEFVGTSTVADGLLDEASAETMAAALRESIEDAAGFAHPYYWAGFYYSG